MKNIKLIAVNAIIAALYTVMTMGFFFSFGPLQLRFSEALCVLSIFSWRLIPGLAAGCALSNLLGALTGANPIGIIDSIVGTFATVSACIVAYFIGKAVKNKMGKILLGNIPIVLFNAIIVGIELMMIFSPTGEYFLYSATLVGTGEVCVLYTLGLFLFLLINKEPRLKELLEKI